MTERKGDYGRRIAAANREAVREYLAGHIGATNKECAHALGLSVMAVGRHVHVLRSEWQERELQAEYLRGHSADLSDV